jgi:hypothetical protein
MNSSEFKQCPVCGFMTLRAEEIYDICPVCMWEDDPLQTDDPSYSGGANELCLIDYKKKWVAEHGRTGKENTRATA